MTVMKESTFWDKVAVTVTPLRTDGAKRTPDLCGARLNIRSLD
jgi:hypothetical protein